MAPRHTNYRNTKAPSEPGAVGEEPKRYVFKKNDDTPVRIRKGPGVEYEHNGKYITNQKKIECVDVQNGWGLLKEYEKGRDGWVCLEYVGMPEA